MGTVKKAAPAQKPTAKTSKEPEVLSPATTPAPGGLGATLKLALDSALKLADIAVAKLRAIAGKKGVAVEQQFLCATLAVEHAQKKLKKTTDTLDELLQIHRDAGGTFEHGLFGIAFPETHKRSPKWKEEAIKLGRELALLKGETWNEDAFCRSIQESYPETTSVSSCITESA
jgi:hypothetical protein